MTELLTSKQVQSLLSIDRTTIYRMLKDGRLTGVKVGNQWRFHAAEIDEMICKTDRNRAEAASTALDVLPLHCVQSIQNIFGQIANVGAVTIDLEGNCLTEISNCSPFCTLMQSSPSGKKACHASRKKIAEGSSVQPTQYHKCHAGLNCLGNLIKVKDNHHAAFMAGQFYTEAPDLAEQEARMQYLASVHKLDAEALTQAAEDIPVLTERKKDQMGEWLKEVAHTFTDLCRERSDVINRLKVISEMSNLDSAVNS